MIPAYDHDGIRLYEGDVRDLLPDIDIAPAVLLTDPPYAAHAYLRHVEQSRQIDWQRDTEWLGNISQWVAQWFVPMRARMTDEGVAWVFANAHYIGFYMRWARLSYWPLRAVFACPPDEYLLSFGHITLTREQGAEVSQACLANTYGQHKPLPLLRALLRASPPGPVIDPFVGLGSTLRAARAEGRDSVGVEIRPELVEQTVRALESEHKPAVNPENKVG